MNNGKNIIKAEEYGKRTRSAYHELQNMIMKKDIMEGQTLVLIDEEREYENIAKALGVNTVNKFKGE